MRIMIYNNITYIYNSVKLHNVLLIIFVDKRPFIQNEILYEVNVVVLSGKYLFKF